MRVLLPALCLIFSSVLLFQCGDDEAEDIVDALEKLAPSFGDKTIADQTYTQNDEITKLSLPEATGGEAPLTYSLEPDLPTGLSFDATAREITGTPTVAAAKKEYTYTATGANDFLADLTFMITVTAVTQSVEVEVSITADKTTVTFPAAGGNYEVKITSSGDWNVKEEIAWLVAVKVDNTTLKVACEANTGDERSGKVTATIEEESVEITVTQKSDTQPSFGAETIDEQTYVENVAINIPAFPAATGGDGTLTYSLTKKVGSGLPAGLSFDTDPATRVLSGTPTDATAEATYVYTATDDDNDAVTLEFDITVEADVPPTFANGTSIPAQTYVVNNPINIPALPAATSGNGPLTYSLTKQDGSARPAWLMFAADTRILSGTTPQSAVSAETYLYKVTDRNGDTDELTFMITVDATDLMPAFANGASIDDETFLENSPIDDLTLPAAMSGNGTLTYSVTPALPNGLILTGRVLSGTPAEGTAAVATTYTYTATDSDGDPTATPLTFMITIQDDLMPTFGSKSVDAQIYTVGAAIAAVDLPGASSGDGTLTYSLTPPAGMDFDPANRRLSGTPNMVSAADYTLIATDEDGDEAMLTFSVTVRANPITLNSETLSVAASSTTDNTIELTSTVAWMGVASSTESWLSVAPLSEASTSSAQEITLTYTQNNTALARTGTVVFTETTTGANPEFSVTLTVTQRAATPAGRIPITHLEQLNAMRYDLNTNGAVDHKEGLVSDAAAEEAYAEAFPDVVYDMDNTTKYTGYELANALDFSDDDHYLDKDTNKPKWTPNDDTPPTNVGWIPVGTLQVNSRFRGNFDGGGHTISNLYINNTNTDTNIDYIGLFGFVLGAIIENVGLESPNVTGRGQNTDLGGLVGHQDSNQGNKSTIRNCYVNGGSITGVGNSVFGLQGVGGLVGFQRSSNMSNCYVSGVTVKGGDKVSVGGLVGHSAGSSRIRSCYVLAGSSTGGDDAARVGGLVGNTVGTILACYVKKGSSTGGDDAHVGGLVGQQGADEIRACYVLNITATGGSGTNVGSLIGNHAGGTITASYAGGKNYTIPLRGAGSAGTVTNSYNQKMTVSGADNADKDVHDKTGGVLVPPTGYTGIYADWNVDVDGQAGADDPWDFGTNNQFPVLNGIDANGDGTIADADLADQRNFQ